MADPVGLTSLGIEACMMLVKYVGEAKNLDKDTSRALKQIRNLDATLRLLKDVLSNSGFDALSSAQLVKDRLLDCEGGITRLKKEVERCLGNPTLEKPGGLKKTMQQAKFPKHKSDLQTLEGHVKELQGDLQLAVEALQSAQQSHQQQQMDRLLDNFARMSVQIQQSSDHAQTQSAQTHAMMHTIQSDLASRHRDRHRLHNDLSARISANPSHTVAADDNDVEEIVREHIPSYSQRQCTCRGRQEIRRWSLLSVLKLTTETISSHEPSCPRFGMASQQNRYSAAFTPFQIWNTAGISTALLFVRAAGASTPSITLRCSRIVPHDHPAMVMMNPRPQLVPLQEIRRSIDCMLRTGVVSATAVAVSGTTLFGRACNRVLCCDDGDESDLKHGLLLLRDLVDAGANVDDVDWHGMTTLQFLSQQYNSPGVSRPVRRRGTNPTTEILAFNLAFKADSDISAPGYQHPLTHGLFARSADLRLRFGLPPVLVAIYARSAKQLSSLLTVHPEHVNETLPGAETVLHAAVGWSQGLEILLHYCVLQPHSRNTRGLTALDIAFRRRETDSVRVLLDAGSPLPSLSRYLATVYDWNLGHQIQNSTEHPITIMYLEKMIWRRHQLRTFAFGHVTAAQKQSFGLNQPRTLDSQALPLVAYLHRSGIVFPPSLDDQQGFDDMTGVYMACHKLSKALLEQLWAYGFRDVASTCTDDAGRQSVPLDRLFIRTDVNTVAPDIHTAAWLIAHGALAPHSTMEQNRIMRAMADRLGYRLGLRSYFPGLLVLRECVEPELPPLFVHQLLGSEEHDSCNCVCSPDGCSTISRYWRGGDDVQTRLLLLKALVEGRSKQLTERVVSQTIRSWIVFYLLLEHTCCTSVAGEQAIATHTHEPSHDFVSMAPEAILEIDQSQQLHVEMLEELVAIMAQALDVSGVEPFEYLLQSFWSQLQTAYADLSKRMAGSGSDTDD